MALEFSITKVGRLFIRNLQSDMETNTFLSRLMEGMAIKSYQYQIVVHNDLPFIYWETSLPTIFLSALDNITDLFLIECPIRGDNNNRR